MLISTKGRYALRVMVSLAEHHTGEYVSLASVAEQQKISGKYLESIVTVLSKAGVIDGVRGKGGGYRLNRSPENYTVGEILRLTDGSLAPVACLEGETNLCERADGCVTLPVWKRLDELISGYLDSVTLADLIAGTTSDMQ